LRSRSKYSTLSEWCRCGVCTLALWAINCLLHWTPLVWLTSDIEPCITFQFSEHCGLVLPICWRVGLCGIGAYLSLSSLLELSHWFACDLSFESSSMLDSCHLLSRADDVWQISFIDADVVVQWPITAGKLVLPCPCLFRSFIEVCHLSRLYLPFGPIPDVLTSLMELCHFSWQTLFGFWVNIPPFTLLTSDMDPWCHRSDAPCRGGIPLDTLTSDIEPCHFKVSLLEALPLDVVTTLSLPSREVSSQDAAGLCATASLSLLNLIRRAISYYKDITWCLMLMRWCIKTISPVEERRVCRIHAGYITVISFGLCVAGLLRMLHSRVLFEIRLR